MSEAQVMTFQEAMEALEAMQLSNPSDELDAIIKGLDADHNRIQGEFGPYVRRSKEILAERVAAYAEIARLRVALMTVFRATPHIHRDAAGDKIDVYREVNRIVLFALTNDPQHKPKGDE